MAFGVIVNVQYKPKKKKTKIQANAPKAIKQTKLHIILEYCT